MKTKIFFVFFALISILNFYLHFSRLTTLPPGPFSDEVDAGYQAICFNRCQTDYFGNKFPVHFHSYSDWRTPLSIYSIALAQKIFGISDFSLRFPAALFGFLVPIAFFFLLRVIYPQHPFRWLLGYFLFTINPWGIHFSRAEWEVTGMLLAFLLGLTFLFYYLKTTQKYFLFLSAFFFILMPYFYATAKLFIIFILVTTAFVFRQQIFSQKKKTLLILIIFCFILLSPLVLDTLKGKAGYRFSYINLFTDPTNSQHVNYYRFIDVTTKNSNSTKLDSWLSLLFHNKLTIISGKFVNNYLASFSPEYLFIKGDSYPRQGFSERGNFLIIDFFVLIIASFLLVFRERLFKFNSFHQYFLILLLLSPVAFSLTRDSVSPQSTRLIIMLPLLLFFITNFLFHILFRLHSKIFSIAVITLYLLFFADFWHFYQTHYLDNSVRFWHQGMKSAVTLALNQTWAQKIYFSDTYEPFIPFFLYYSQYSTPNHDCSVGGNFLHEENSSSFSGLQANDKFYFGTVNWSHPSDLNSTDNLFVVPKTELNLIPNDKFKLEKIGIINKDYSSQEEFVLLRPRP